MKKPARNTAPNKNPTPPNVEKIIKRVEAEMVAIANSPQASENSKPSDSRPWDITPEKMRLALAAVCELCKEKGIPLRKGLEMTRESAGRPIMVSVEFRETPEFWEGYLWRDDDKQTPLFTFSMPIRQAGRPAGEWNPATDTLGVENAKVEFLKFVYPNSSPCCEMEVATFDEFKSEFLRRTRGYILDCAGSFGIFYMPSNYQSEILNLGVMKQFGQNLQGIPAKRRDMIAVKSYLLNGWTEKDLHKLDRFELAASVKANAGIDFKPDAVWKIAERLGLFSSRDPGPKPKS